MAQAGVLDLAPLPVATLSGGERQRVALARALCQEPRLLALDEPTAHLDLRYQAECIGLLRRINRDRGTTVILVSHDLNLAAEVCDRLLLLAAGRVVCVGPPSDVLDAGRLSAVYGCDVTVSDNALTGRPLSGVRLMHLDGLGDLIADGVDRRQRRHRVLEHHADRVAAKPRHGVVR